MPTSTTDHEESQTIASSSSFSFDNSSAMSEREDFLLVLVSSFSGSGVQGRNQKRSLTILKACGIKPEVLDAADPGNVLVRDELCELSGIRGVFPQFFLVQGDKTSFFADFAELEHMNDVGMLAKWLSMELPTAKSSSIKKQVTSGAACTMTPANGVDYLIYENEITNDDRMIDCNDVGFDQEHDALGNTRKLLNVASISKQPSSFDVNVIAPDEQRQTKIKDFSVEHCRGNDDGSKHMFGPTSRASILSDDWSNHSLSQQYEDEILALEDILQVAPVEQKEGTQAEILQQKAECNEFRSNGGIPESENSVSLTSPRSNEDESDKNQNKNDEKAQKDDILPLLSSTATTGTISPTSSSSRSLNRNQVNESQTIKNNLLALPSASPSSSHKNNDKGIPCNVSMETVSSRSEVEQVLQAKVEELMCKCERLTAERYIMEGQLKEARQRNKHKEEQSSTRLGIDTIHKLQLQKVLTCAYCTKSFKSNPSSMSAPIASQACGHSICRNCCHTRLSAARRYRDENILNRSERLRNTISSDLFMCGMGDMSQVYSPSFDEHQRQLQAFESCPICSAPRSFRHGKLYINESLCIVLKLLDS